MRRENADRRLFANIFGVCTTPLPNAERRRKWPVKRKIDAPGDHRAGKSATRVSTGEQATQAQEIELRSAGCDVVVQEHGSGASRARPACRG